MPGTKIYIHDLISCHRLAMRFNNKVTTFTWMAAKSTKSGKIGH